MIKLNMNFNTTFIDEYFNYCHSNFLSAKIANVRAALPDDDNTKLYFDSLFNKDSLREIIESPANELECIIKTCFNLLPILAERYCYSYLLGKLAIHSECDKIPLLNENQYTYFDSIVENTIVELEKLTRSSHLIATNYYINVLKDPNIKRSDKKKILCKLENAARGNSILTSKYIEMFPPWVNLIELAFDYNTMAREYGYQLTDNADVTICAYCGLEKIQTYSNSYIQVRHDLDHFYPKSRFPFLALSLYNLIPAGSICNQKHKRNTPMLGYMHPYLESIQGDVFFNFSYIESTNIEDTLKVGVVLQHNFKDKNISLFKIQHLYNGDEELRSWYSTLYSICEFHKSNGDNLASIDFTSPLLRHTIVLNKPATKVSAQQFKVDAINDLFGTQLRTIEQCSKP
ncbi:hypothetical protein NB714_000580 [Pantoea dispersa]|nr:hypothetical protein [Pantoea dispersa]MCW0324455.1 hypothetical protein [Pantoea dispersa]MCW0431818.1 hypothetical protein [Pantoea dispersa]